VTTASQQKAQTFKINWQHLQSLALNRLLNVSLSRFVFISHKVFVFFLLLFFVSFNTDRQRVSMAVVMEL